MPGRRRPEVERGGAVARPRAASRIAADRRAWAIRVLTAALATIAALPPGSGARDLDTPHAVPAFDGRQLDARGIETIGDLQFQPPSTVASDTSELTVRGVGAALFPGGQSAVAFAQDGVVAARAAPLAELYDLERVDLLRGPVGPSDGRAVGGAARLTTRRPTDDFAAGLNYEIGSRAESRLRATLNAPFVGDRAAARLAVLYGEERRSYALRAGGARDSVLEDLLSVRTSLRYRLSEDARADASWTFTRRDAAPLQLGDGASRTPGEQGHFGTLGLVWRLGDFVLTSISGYQSAESSLRLGDTVASDDVRLWTSRLELAFDDGGPFQVRMGLGYRDEKNEGAGESRVTPPGTRPSATRGFNWYSYSESRRDNGQHWGTCTRTSTSTAGRDQSAVLPVAFAQAYARTVDGFTDVTYEVLPGWRALAGFRIAYEERELVDRSVDLSTKRRRERNPVTWRVGASIDVAERTLLHGTIGKADRPGSFDVASLAAFADEDLLAYQIGAEQRLFADRARLDFTAFYYDYDDVQTFAASASGLRAASLPEAESYGVELESTAAVPALGGLVLDAAVGWLHTRISRGEISATDLAGNELPLAPQLTAHVGAEYTLLLAERIAAVLPGSLIARADYTFRDRMYFDAANQFAAGAWNFADLRLIYEPELDGTGLRVEAFIENLWNERALTAVHQLRTDPATLVAYNQPRTFGLRVSTTFD